MSFSTNSTAGSPFAETLAPFLQADGLPFADVLTAADIDEASAAAGVVFGRTSRSLWTPALTLWTFLSQVLDPNQSCRAAVARALVAVALTRPLRDGDTGNYCRARAKLPTALLQQLALQVGQGLEQASPTTWLWHGRHVQLADGFTVTLPDTVENQKQYPQPNTQKPGLGFPIMRLVLLVSLATAAVQGLAFGPYQGKETGETALLRTLFEQLRAGDIVLADRYYCSYFMLVLLRDLGVDVVLRLHQRRRCDLRRGRRLGPNDHCVTWHKPARPDWLDAATYAALPAQLEVRELRKDVTQPGCRVKTLHVVTTLLDADVYNTEDIAELYHQRWQVELDIRSLKCTLKMDELRCLTPFMVEKEIWAHVLAYNLVRKVAAQAALQRGVSPRSLSFAASQQLVLGAWSKLTEATPAERRQLAAGLLVVLGKERVGQRPGRCEPRAKKRRPKKGKLLTKPRAAARADQLAGRVREKAA